MPKRYSIKDAIAKNRRGQRVPSTADAAGPPSMMHVLAGMKSVQLRSVDRSPGGTPLRQAPIPTALDPTAIIAAALRRKFAHRIEQNADDIEDDWRRKENDILQRRSSKQVAQPAVAVRPRSCAYSVLQSFPSPC